MKLSVACKICKELGSTTIGEAILFVKAHAPSLSRMRKSTGN